MEHLDFVAWMIGWIWCIKGTSDPPEEAKNFCYAFWFIMWFGVGGLLYFT